MTNTKITSHAELEMHIMHLKAEKFQKEIELKDSFRGFLYSLNPVSILKGSLHELAKDKEVQFDLVKTGLNAAGSLLIGKVMGRYNSIKGFLSSVLAEKVFTSYVSNKATEIIPGIRNLLHRQPEQETNY